MGNSEEGFTLSEMRDLQEQERRKSSRDSMREKIVEARSEKRRIKSSVRQKRDNPNNKEGFTFEEMQEIQRQDEMGNFISGAETVGEVLGDYGGRFLDSALSAPIRAGISGLQELVPDEANETYLGNLKRAGSMAREAFLDEPELSPSGIDIIRKTKTLEEGGLAETALGMAMEMAADPSTFAFFPMQGLLKLNRTARVAKLNKSLDAMRLHNPEQFKILQHVADISRNDARGLSKTLQTVAAQKMYNALDAQITSDKTTERILREGRHTEETLGRVALDHGIDLSDQEKALDKIRGTVNVETKVDAEEAIRSGGKNVPYYTKKAIKRNQDGVIYEITEDTNKLIEIVGSSNPKLMDVDMSNVGKELIGDFKKSNYDQLSGVTKSDSDIKKYEKMYSDLVLKEEINGEQLLDAAENVTDMGQEFWTGKPFSLNVDGVAGLSKSDEFNGAHRTLTQLQSLKKKIGDRLSDSEFRNDIPEKMVEKTVLKDVYRKINDVIKSKLDLAVVPHNGQLVNAGWQVGKNNHEVESLMEITEILYSNIGSRNKSRDVLGRLLEIKDAVVNGTAAGVAFQDTKIGISVGLGIMGLRKTKDLSKTARSSARQARMIDDLAKGTDSKLAETAKAIYKGAEKIGQGAHLMSKPERALLLGARQKELNKKQNKERERLKERRSKK